MERTSAYQADPDGTSSSAGSDPVFGGFVLSGRSAVPGEPVFGLGTGGAVLQDNFVAESDPPPPSYVQDEFFNVHLVGHESRSGTEPGSRSYTVFKVQSRRGDLLYVVYRRYREFEDLHRALQLECAPTPVPNMPPKRYLASSMDPEFVRQRQAALEEFMLAVCRDSKLRSSAALAAFLVGESEPPAPAARLERIEATLAHVLDRLSALEGTLRPGMDVTDDDGRSTAPPTALEELMIRLEALETRVAATGHKSELIVDDPRLQRISAGGWRRRSSGHSKADEGLRRWNRSRRSQSSQLPRRSVPPLGDYGDEEEDGAAEEDAEYMRRYMAMRRAASRPRTISHRFASDALEHTQASDPRGRSFSDGTRAAGGWVLANGRPAPSAADQPLPLMPVSLTSTPPSHSSPLTSDLGQGAMPVPLVLADNKSGTDVSDADNAPFAMELDEDKDLSDLDGGGNIAGYMRPSAPTVPGGVPDSSPVAGVTAATVPPTSAPQVSSALLQQPGALGPVAALPRPSTATPVSASGSTSAVGVARTGMSTVPDFVPDTVPADVVQEVSSHAVVVEAVHELIVYIGPSVIGEAKRLEVFEVVTGIIKRALGACAYAYGSYALKTYLPDGDIDVSAFFSHSNDAMWVPRLVNALCTEASNTPAGGVGVAAATAAAAAAGGGVPGANSGLAGASTAAAGGSQNRPSIRSVTFVNSETRVVRCTIGNIDVDISGNQEGAVGSLAFFEEVNRLVGRDNLLKRSMLLTKSWFANEAQVMGGQRQLMTSYSVRTLVLCIFNAYHEEIVSPLDAHFRLLQYLDRFDWNEHALSLFGPLSIRSLPVLDAVMNAPCSWPVHTNWLISRPLLEKYSPGPAGQTSSAGPTAHYFTILDPINPLNNLVRGVSFENSRRIREIISAGAREFRRAIFALSNCIRSRAPPAVVHDEVRKLFPATLRAYVRYQYTSGRVEARARGPLLNVDLETILEQWAHAQQFVVPDMSETTLVALVTRVLQDHGSVPVGKLGSLLHQTTNNHSLPATLKEKYGGLKRFLQRHNQVFHVGDDHQFNPTVFLRSDLAVPAALATSAAMVAPDAPASSSEPVSAEAEAAPGPERTFNFHAPAAAPQRLVGSVAPSSGGPSSGSGVGVGRDRRGKQHRGGGGGSGGGGGGGVGGGGSSAALAVSPQVGEGVDPGAGSPSIAAPRPPATLPPPILPTPWSGIVGSSPGPGPSHGAAGVAPPRSGASPRATSSPRTQPPAQPAAGHGAPGRVVAPMSQQGRGAPPKS